MKVGVFVNSEEPKTMSVYRMVDLQICWMKCAFLVLLSKFDEPQMKSAKHFSHCIFTQSAACNYLMKLINMEQINKKPK